MALINQEVIPPKKEHLTVRLDPELVRQLECYCRFIQSCQNYVIEQLLSYTMRRDREFQDWLAKHGTTAGEDGAPAHAADANER